MAAPKPKRRDALDTRPRLRVRAGVQSGKRQALYEGATRGYRLGDKGLNVSGPDAEAERSLDVLRRRSRYVIQNNPYANSAKTKYIDAIVGNGIKAKWPTKELQKLWDIFVTECDADGHNDFYGLQGLVAGAEFSDGEVLCRRRWRRPSDGLEVPFQIEVMEADHLPLSLNEVTKNIRLGIQYNPIGQRINYYLLPHHPSEYLNFFQSPQIKASAVQAGDVIHFFNRLRPKQNRGIPHLSTILLRLYEIDEMQDATLVKQKTAQLFAWIIQKRQKPFPEFNADGESDGALGLESESDEEGTQIAKVKPGGVHYLDEDEEAKFSEPAAIGNMYTDWLKTELRAAAIGVGETYERFTGDLTGVNYSSIRAGLIDFRRRIERLQHHLMVFKLCHPVARWFLEHAWLSGKDLGITPEQYLYEFKSLLPKWKTPRWDWVDPLKDVMADILETRAGFTTRKNKNAERGLDYDEVTETLMQEQGVSDVKDLVLDSNPRSTTKSGALQQGLQILQNSE